MIEFASDHILRDDCTFINAMCVRHFLLFRDCMCECVRLAGDDEGMCACVCTYVRVCVWGGEGGMHR